MFTYLNFKIFLFVVVTPIKNLYGSYSNRELCFIDLLLNAQLHNANQLSDFLLDFVAKNFEIFEKMEQFQKLTGKNLSYVMEHRWPPLCYCNLMKEWKEMFGEMFREWKEWKEVFVEENKPSPEMFVEENNPSTEMFVEENNPSATQNRSRKHCIVM